MNEIKTPLKDLDLIKWHGGTDRVWVNGVLLYRHRYAPNAEMGVIEHGAWVNEDNEAVQDAMMNNHTSWSKKPVDILTCVKIRSISAITLFCNPADEWQIDISHPSGDIFLKVEKKQDAVELFDEISTLIND